MVRNIAPLFLTLKYQTMLLKLLSRPFLLLASVASLAVTSCSYDLGFEDNVQAATLNITGEDANGAKERPNPVTTSATGTISGTFDPNTNILTYTINWTGLSGPPTGAHFHGPADRNTAAPVLIPIALPSGAGVSGTVTGTATLNDQQKSQLIGELIYYNIHTDVNPGGEIRGQVVPQ
jgi:hypothetical protein